jgi:hypothetical protein
MPRRAALAVFIGEAGKRSKGLRTHRALVSQFDDLAFFCPATDVGTLAFEYTCLGSVFET